MKKREIKTKNRITKKIPISPILLISILLLGVTFSKYVDEKNKESAYIADSFYFESSILQDNVTIPVYEYQKGVDKISFDLNNFIDELRFSDVEINYNVMITDTNGSPVQDKSGKNIPEKTGYFASSSGQTQNIEFENLKSGTYTVTAETTSPFKKTIKANFVISDDNEIKYSVSDISGSPTLQLIVTSKDYNGKVSLTWPQGLIPDNTDPKFANINTGSESGTCVIDFKANSEYAFQFFKQNPTKKFTKEEFSIGKE